MDPESDSFLEPEIPNGAVSLAINYQKMPVSGSINCKNDLYSFLGPEIAKIVDRSFMMDILLLFLTDI